MATKKLLITFFCSLFFVGAFSQQNFRNEWIDYSKTYYKFKVGPFGFDAVNAPIKSGVVRIPQSTLAAAGLGSAPAGQFQLWHNGEQLPIYVSKPSGILSSSDYIEFWGTINDGTLDKDLYPDSAFQLSDYWSLQTDSASYFLTVSSSGNPKRFIPEINNTSNIRIQPEKNFMYTTGRYFRTQISGGYALQLAQTLYSSTYDKGEGWMSRGVHPNNCGCGATLLPQNFSPLYLDTGGAAMIVNLSCAGNATNARQVKFSLNGNLLSQFEMDYFSDAKITVPNIPANNIHSDDAVFTVEDASDVAEDEMVVSKIELNYPHLFNFGNATSFEFFLNASDSGRYLRITNFNGGNTAPVLYDIANKKRYVGDISLKGLVLFVLKPSSQNYHLVLARSDGSAATTISSLQSRNFVDFSKKINQANYLIISNPLIYGRGSSNFVEQYRAYRSSVAGGAFNAKIFDINELTDQFAWGIKKHPLSIKNFLKFARRQFVNPPQFAFLIGKGVTYNAYRLNETNPLADELNLVPTWGFPGSDNLLSSDDYTAIPATPIGRLSAVSAQEVENYLNKIKQYEAAQKNTGGSIENKSWMKTVLQLTGSDDPVLGVQLDKYMLQYKNIISDTFYGGNVINFSKTADPGGYPQALANFKNIYENGSGLLTYFGHSSSTALDFNLDNPDVYNNTGKYPVFIVNGCLSGNIFDYDENRLSLRSTISEKFVLEPGKGAIGYLATSSFGISNYLNIFTRKFYAAVAKTEYGKGFGEIIKDGITKGLNITGINDFYGKIHAEQYTFHGDPALKMNNFSKPDYAIENPEISVTPNFISVADDSFYVKIRIYNLGKAISDSVHFSLSRKYPDGNSEIIFRKEIAPVNSIDSLTIALPIVANRDKGTSYVTASIDDNNKIDELSENNNHATANILISDADVRPIYPYNYSIVNKNIIALYASTSNPLEGNKQYIFQMDTTALFNSPVKHSLKINSKGGIIKFDNLPLQFDATVYYWRIAQIGANLHWQSFSFTHNTVATDGFEQAHFYQHTQSALQNIYLDSSTRQFNFTKRLTDVFVRQAIFPTSGNEDVDFSISVNGSTITASACLGSSIIYNVFDTLNFKPWQNTTNPFGAAPVCDTTRKFNFEYSTQSASTRKNAMNFFDSIPNGDYVIVRKIYDLGNQDWAPTVWAADTALYGHGNSLYNRFKSQGLQIDSFVYPRTFIFLFRKNDASHFTPLSVFSQGLYDKINLTQNIVTTDTLGYITSPKFGPAKTWNSLTWNGVASDANDVVSVDVIGVTADAQQKVLYTLNSSQHQLNIAAINANKFPCLMLRMKNQDSITATPYQLKNWIVQYTPVPEGGVAPNLGINIPDTIFFNHNINKKFDTLSGYVTFKNVSDYDFKKLKLKLVIYDSSNKAHIFSLPYTKILKAGDTLHASFLINVTALPEEKYNLFFEVNADNDQPEQYFFNNFLYKYLYLKRSTATQSGIDFAATEKKIEVEKNSIKVYPNPFNNVLNISVNEPGKNISLLRLFNSLGEQLLQKTFISSTSLNVSNLAAGNYILQINDGSQTKTFTIQKQK
ncbi:MAG: C25 family cysteine peptidase [Chitinophagaceae bacterium]